LERGLVDKNGSFEDALAAARARAKLPADARVAYLETELSPLQRLAAGLGGQALGQFAERLGLPLSSAALPAGVATEARDDLTWLAEMKDRSPIGMPFMALTHCLCGR
jgi:protease-4